MGWTTSPYLRAGALSCPSLAIYGPGSYGAPAFRFAAPPRPDALSPLPLMPVARRIIPDGMGVPSPAVLGSYRGGAMRYSSSPWLSLSLSQSSYFWPLGMSLFRVTKGRRLFLPLYGA